MMLFCSLMKFFIDTANLDQIKEAEELGILDGVTTNPSLMAKEGIVGEQNILDHYLKICDIVDGYIDPDVKKNFSKLRNQKQAAFWLLSYKNSKHGLSLKQKWSFVSKILKLDFSLKNSYRIFS